MLGHGVDLQLLQIFADYVRRDARQRPAGIRFSSNAIALSLATRVFEEAS